MESVERRLEVVKPKGNGWPNTLPVCLRMRGHATVPVIAGKCATWWRT